MVYWFLGRSCAVVLKSWLGGQQFLGGRGGGGVGVETAEWSEATFTFSLPSVGEKDTSVGHNDPEGKVGREGVGGVEGVGRGGGGEMIRHTTQLSYWYRYRYPFTSPRVKRYQA